MRAIVRQGDAAVNDELQSTLGKLD